MPTQAVTTSLAKSAVLKTVSAAVQSVLGQAVAAEAPLMEVGLDSLGALELRNALSQQFEVELPATFTFDYPTAQAMAAYIASIKGIVDLEAPEGLSGGMDGGSNRVPMMGTGPLIDQRLVQSGQARMGRGLQAMTGISVR